MADSELLSEPFSTVPLEMLGSMPSGVAGDGDLLSNLMGLKSCGITAACSSFLVE